MAANRTYSMSQAAKMVGEGSKPLPISTIRNWAKAFKAHLSPAANPESGSERRFDDRDIAVLRLIAQLRDDHVSWADIDVRLAETNVAAGEVIAPSTPGAIAIPDPAETLPAPAETPPAALATVEAFDQRLRAVEARQAAQTWRSTPALWLAVGVTLGVVLGAVVVIMALQLVGR